MMLYMMAHHEQEEQRNETFHRRAVPHCFTSGLSTWAFRDSRHRTTGKCKSIPWTHHLHVVRVCRVISRNFERTRPCLMVPLGLGTVRERGLESLAVRLDPRDMDEL